jgi:lysozyme family protein
VNYEQSKRGYANLWAKTTIRPEKLATVRAIAKKLTANKPRYEKVAKQIGCPWWMVACVHQMESNTNWATHLHNGDPLTHRTTHVPAGRPLGNPPFTWEASALDALRLKAWDKVASWEIPRCLYELERYNGFGYVSKGINSPYLWSYTTLYAKGKYVADGRYDANAVSSQCGAAAIMKELLVSNLADLLAPFEAIAPTVLRIVAGPVPAIAIKALAEAFKIPETTEPAVAEKVNATPLSGIVQAVQAAEELLGQLGQVTGPTPPPEPAAQPSSSGLPAGSTSGSPIDKIVPALTGWKTYIGIAIYGGAWVAGALGYLTPELVSAIQGFGMTVGGVGLISKLDRWLSFFGKKA